MSISMKDLISELTPGWEAAPYGWKFFTMTKIPDGCGDKFAQ